MSYENVKKYFENLGLSKRIITRDNIDTVTHAAKVIGCKEARIAKTMSFIVKDEPLVIVMSGDAKIDNAKYKAYFHQKAKMIAYEDVETIIGHPPGGVCPFALNPNINVYLDISLKRFETSHAAAGSANSTIELSPEELEKYTNAKDWIDVCKWWK